MDEHEPRYDFFLAHAGADRAVAEQLYDALVSWACVFLDSKCLLAGDDWDSELKRAQQMSRITLVLISASTRDAYYEREEIAAAIAMARGARHRVVPVYLGQQSSDDHVPYGLRVKHGITLAEPFCFDQAAAQLRELLDSVSPDGRKPHATTTQVVFDQSYSQDQWYGEPTLAAGYRGIPAVLGASVACRAHGGGYEIADALKGAGVLVLPTPFRTHVPESHYRQIVRWVQNGGGLLVMGFYLMEAHHQNNLNQLLRRFGFEFRKDLLMPLGRESFRECMAQSFAFQDTNLWIVGPPVPSKGDHTLARGLARVGLTSSCGIECAESPEFWLATPEDVVTFHARGFKDPESGRIVRLTEYVLDGHGKAPFLCAIHHGKGKVVGVGSWKLFLDPFLERADLDNARLLKNCVEWLAV